MDDHAGSAEHTQPVLRTAGGILGMRTKELGLFDEAKAVETPQHLVYAPRLPRIRGQVSRRIQKWADELRFKQTERDREGGRVAGEQPQQRPRPRQPDRKSTRLNSSHLG